MCKFLPPVEFCRLLLICLAFSVAVNLAGNLTKKTQGHFDKNVSMKDELKASNIFSVLVF